MILTTGLFEAHLTVSDLKRSMEFYERVVGLERAYIVEAREAPDNQTLQKTRKLSAGLSFQDLRVIQSNLDGISAASARKRCANTSIAATSSGTNCRQYRTPRPNASTARSRTNRCPAQWRSRQSPKPIRPLGWTASHPWPSCRSPT